MTPQRRVEREQTLRYLINTVLLVKGLLLLGFSLPRRAYQAGGKGENSPNEQASVRNVGISNIYVRLQC